MDKQKAQRKVKADLPGKYTGMDRQEKRLLVDYLPIVDPVWPLEDVLKSFVDYWGLTYLAEKAKKYAGSPLGRAFQRTFV